MVTDLPRISTSLPFLPSGGNGNNADDEIKIFVFWLVILSALLQVTEWPRHAFQRRSLAKRKSELTVTSLVSMTCPFDEIVASLRNTAARNKCSEIQVQTCRNKPMK